MSTDEKRIDRLSAPHPAIPAPVLRRILRLLSASPPPTLELLGRALLHAALVGLAVGLVSLFFVEGLELAQEFVLERLTGYVPLRAAGEGARTIPADAPFRPWLLVVVPALGALVGGIASTIAPETRGGGSDAIIGAFHHEAGAVRRRVPLVKMFASIATLGAGGSGGREGPTMLIGGSIGSLVGRYLRVTARERRTLLVAGTAAGMAAVFRTPLGAALLAVEVLHRDDFESEALVPSVLASVVSYSVFISFFGEGTLFAHAPRYPFVPAHLPLYGAMALFVSGAAVLFARTLHAVKGLTRRARAPEWAKPAVGGLLLGLLATPIIVLLGDRMGPGHGLGVLGGGYGAAQVAILGASWFPEGWRGVEVLVVLGLVKLLATSLTVGSGGSAGDFGPSMVIGGIFGGAFGRAAQLVFEDPGIDPGAFALVGMGTFYGGLAHVPIGSIIMTCELAGSYDLLVPLMLCEGIAFIALRGEVLYSAQVPSRRASPAHRDELVGAFLESLRVDDVLVRRGEIVSFREDSPAREVIASVAKAEWQDSFPVLDVEGTLRGVIVADILRAAAVEPDIHGLVLAADMMAPAVVVRESDDLRHALELLVANGMRELLVVDEDGKVTGAVDQSDITTALTRTTGSA